MSTKTAVYTHGHHPSVLRSHSWRTAANSAGYLLQYLQSHMKILDIGCGPGTITVDLATLVPNGHVTGLDSAQEVLNQARNVAISHGTKNVDFILGDVHTLSFPDNSFDVVHAHQVLQHIGDPVQALREIHRVVKKPGGIIAVRDVDFEATTCYPESQGMSDWLNLYQRVTRANGGEPNAGRRLHVWARRAGIDPSRITATAGTWCYRTAEERTWWSDLWAERTVASSFARSAVEGGHATEGDLVRIAQEWRDWGADEDGWVVLLHGEIICHT